MKNRILAVVGAVWGLFLLASCSTTNKTDNASAFSTAGAYEAADYGSGGWTGRTKSQSSPLGRGVLATPASPPERPGLGTEWGENQRDEVNYGEFVRTSSKPSGTAKLFYNDEEGAKAMANSSGYRSRSDGKVGSSDGSVTMSLKSGFRTLKGFYSGGNEFVIGEDRQKYAIHIQNNTSRRIEVVASVDGLDVMDGQSASYSKRGYILKSYL